MNFKSVLSSENTGTVLVRHRIRTIQILAIGVLLSSSLATSADTPLIQGYCGPPPPNSWFQFSSSTIADVKAQLISTLTARALADYPRAVAAWFAANGGVTRPGPGCQIELHASSPFPPITYCPNLLSCSVQLNGDTWSTCGGSESPHGTNTFLRIDGGCYFGYAPQQKYSITVLGLAAIEPGNLLQLQAKVIDSNNQPVTGAIVHVKVEAVSQSGGHIHGDDNDPRRRGTLSGVGPEIVATSPTGADGMFRFTFNAPSVSGIYKFTGWCDNKTCTQQGANTMDVKIDGLMPLPESINFIRAIGQTNRHPENHYLTPAAIDKANTLAYYYKDPFSNAPLLRYNDASLQWGGLFDLDGDWRPSHKEHRRGTVIDVRANRTDTAIPVRNYEMFKKLIRRKIKGDFLHENIGTPNEHFHVRLLYKAE